jgi:hypothetical protein
VIKEKSMVSAMRSRTFVWSLSLVALACDQQELPESSFYDERIGPTLEFGCAEQTTGCHIANTRGEATGNLDVTSYDALIRRRDALTPYGPYPVPLLLLKAGDQRPIQVETFGSGMNRFVEITTDIRHNAGSTIELDATTYGALKRWMDAGATRTGVPPETLSESNDECRNGAGNKWGFDPANLPGDTAGFDRFVSDVWPVMRDTCAGTACHGNPSADLYLTCGDSDEELRWNYFVSVEHLTAQVVTSELLNRPLSQFRGGTFHEGGDVFADAMDERYLAIRSWAEDLVARVPSAVEPRDTDPGLLFYANRVQPVLVRKGCMFLNCHSPSMGHDLPLRGGSRGVFSRIGTRHNYEIARLMLAIESPNPNDSRIIAKNLYPPSQVDGTTGIPHRGGSLFEDFGAMGTELVPADPSLCATVDADAGDLNTIPAYCVLARWHEIEREQAITRGELAPDPISGVVYVSRPPGTGDPRDFDTFRGGADLRIASAMQAADGALTLGSSTSVLGGCGLGASADVRTPAVSWDGTRIAFAARPSAGEPLRIYEMNADGTGCAPLAGIAPSTNSENGVLTHDFDPAYSADGRLVFASTRGNLDRARYSYAGPTRTPAAMQPNANLYVFESGAVRQLTFLLNQEVAPSFMTDGRLIMSAEKREPEFHQVALRRQNLDGGDYHPLFAQRESLGFRASYEVVELMNRNFAFIATGLDATDGAGAIGLVNRSIGPDQSDRDPADRFYFSSFDFLVPGAVGGLTGVYRSPAILPSGRFLVSCDQTATSATAGPFAFQLCEVDASSGAVRAIGGEAGRANVEAAAIFPRVDREVFTSRLAEVNGASVIDPSQTDSIVAIADAGLLATLMFANTRTGRPIPQNVGGITVFEALPPAPGSTTFGDVAANVQMDAFGQVFVDYRELGTSATNPDSSLRIRIPGGTPILLRMNDDSNNPLMFDAHPLFTGEMRQREQIQFYPGERIGQSFPRRLFNGVCAMCHGSITGRELDSAVNVDIISQASQTLAREQAPIDMMP